MIQSREQLKQYCLRTLGAPVIEINVADEQLEDRIDEALQYYSMYHYDGLERMYLKHQITQEDFDNKYINLPYDVRGVTRIFSFNYSSRDQLLNFETQYRLDIIANLNTASLSDYQITMNHLQLIDHVLAGQILIRFNKNNGKLYLDTNWSKLTVGSWIVIDGYQLIDPEIETRMFNDPWLKLYVTALFKKQWGSNLSKFSNMLLPGGVSIDGQSIYDTAYSEQKELEQQLVDEQSPASLFIG
jgi:hypothetical protein